MYKILFEDSDRYDIIYTDPPWSQKKGGERTVRPNQKRQLDYDTMTLDDIKIFHESLLSSLTNRKHNVFMWTIDKFLPETEKFMDELGYTLHCRFIWDKTNGIAPAFTIRFAHEYLLWFYKKGNILMPSKETRGKYTTVVREASTIHSRKPISVYEMLEDMFPDARKLEVFARIERESWDCWGNGIENTEK